MRIDESTAYRDTGISRCFVTSSICRLQMIYTVGFFLQKLCTIDDVKKHRGIPVSRYFLRRFIIVGHFLIAYRIQPFGHNRHGPRMGRCRALFSGVGSWVPI